MTEPYVSSFPVMQAADASGVPYGLVLRFVQDISIGRPSLAAVEIHRRFGMPVLSGLANDLNRGFRERRIRRT